MPNAVDHHQVVWPRGVRRVDVIPNAARPGTLAGKTVAFTWDYLFRGDEIFETLKEGLRQRYPDIRFVDYEAFGNTHGGDEREVLAQLPGKLRLHAVDAVISGMGC
jgi:hypothetical protein